MPKVVDIRGQFLEVTADRLFALVDAEDRLEPRLDGRRGGLADVQRERVGGLRVEAPFVGQVKDSSPLESAERVNFLEDRSPFRLVQVVEDFG